MELELMQHKKLKALKERYGYELSLDKESIAGMSQREIYEILLVTDLDQKIVDSITEYMDDWSSREEINLMATTCMVEVLSRQLHHIVSEVEKVNAQMAEDLKKKLPYRKPDYDGIDNPEV